MLILPYKDHYLPCFQGIFLISFLSIILIFIISFVIFQLKMVNVGRNVQMGNLLIFFFLF